MTIQKLLAVLIDAAVSFYRFQQQHIRTVRPEPVEGQSIVMSNRAYGLARCSSESLCSVSKYAALHFDTLSANGSLTELK